MFKLLQAEQDLARLEMEMGKQTVTNEIMDDYIKRNVDQNSAGVAEKFAPENLQRLNDLNKEAGRFPTNWAKDLADIANTKQSQAYNEFEGLAKQYVQDQLRKIYGAQFTEAEGESRNFCRITVFFYYIIKRGHNYIGHFRPITETVTINHMV